MIETRERVLRGGKERIEESTPQRLERIPESVHPEKENEQQRQYHEEAYKRVLRERASGALAKPLVGIHG
jgi:hypothetical protein